MVAVYRPYTHGRRAVVELHDTEIGTRTANVAGDSGVLPERVGRVEGKVVLLRDTRVLRRMNAPVYGADHALRVLVVLGRQDLVLVLAVDHRYEVRQPPSDSRCDPRG